MSLTYEWRETDGEAVTCDSCQCAAPLAEFDWAPSTGPHEDAPYRMLCEFCSTTMASRHTEYPQLEEFGLLRAEIWRAAANVFNMLTQRSPQREESALRAICALTFKLTELRQAECKHLVIELFAPELFGKLLREQEAATQVHHDAKTKDST